MVICGNDFSVCIVDMLITLTMNNPSNTCLLLPFFFLQTLHMNTSDCFSAFIISLYHPKQISFCHFLFILLKAFRSWVSPFFCLCLECLSYFTITVSFTSVLNFTPSFTYEIALKPKRDSAENHSGL